MPYEFRRFALAFSFLLLLPVFILGCKPPSLISGVAYKVEPNIETIKVQLNFGSDVRSDLGGTFPIDRYGAVELSPWTPSSPFSVGFRMNMNIVNDQEFMRLTPVTTLPSGQPLPTIVNRAMARLQLKNEVNPNFDIFVYVDIIGKEWVGVVVTLKFIDAKYFPAGLSISQNFLKDQAGYARATATVFGPKIDSSGRMSVPGGIALFANGAALLRSGAPEGYDPVKNLFAVEGPQARFYEEHPEMSAQIAEAFKALLNANLESTRDEKQSPKGF